jgi:hypothetical protein
MAEGCEGLTSRFSLELGSCLEPGTELCCLVKTDHVSYFFSNCFNRSLSSRESHALVSLHSAACDLPVWAVSCRGGVRDLASRGRGLVGEEAAPGSGTAKVRRPWPRRGSLGLHSEPEELFPTLTDKEEGAASGDKNEDLIAAEAVAGTLRGDFNGGASPGDFRPGDFSLGSRPRGSALDEVPGPYFVGETILSFESSGLAMLGLSELTWLLPVPPLGALLALLSAAGRGA